MQKTINDWFFSIKPRGSVSKQHPRKAKVFLDITLTDKDYNYFKGRDRNISLQRLENWWNSFNAAIKGGYRAAEKDKRKYRKKVQDPKKRAQILESARECKAKSKTMIYNRKLKIWEQKGEK